MTWDHFNLIAHFYNGQHKNRTNDIDFWKQMAVSYGGPILFKLTGAYLQEGEI
jgi:hypothetical protein